MFLIQNILVSIEIIQINFQCHTSLCHSQCCIEGDAGAPITKEELATLQQHITTILPNLSQQAQRTIQQYGLAYIDQANQLVLNTINNKQCVFFNANDPNNNSCTLQQLYQHNITPCNKPISCQLYPIREVSIKTSNNQTITGLEYNRWNICKTAHLNTSNKTPKLYQFLKQPLINRFGLPWYNELNLTASIWNQQSKQQ